LSAFRGEGRQHPLDVVVRGLTACGVAGVDIVNCEFARCPMSAVAAEDGAVVRSHQNLCTEAKVKVLLSSAIF
jgi:hypothetical protein